jgi:murein DD-endopeptidase MepM/ murein hydrolase activator NlpD
VTIYAHMKYNSPVFEQSLLCTTSPGTKIGEVGSSGRSTYYHLHFELWNSTGGSVRIDPFSGNCSQGTSYWVNQNNGAPTTACQ